MIRYTGVAEENEYDSVWVSEDLGFRDAIVPLTSFAMKTKVIRLATGIIPLYYRSPALTAMTLATLDELSHGRLILGIGNGVRSWIEKQGIAFRNPLEAIKEYVEIVQGILSGKTISYSGRTYAVKDVRLSFKPSRSKIPVYIASRGPKMFQMAGKIADGALMCDGFFERTYVQWALENLRIGAESAGRNRKDVRLASYVWVSVSEDRDKAKEWVKPWLVNLLLEGAYDRHIERMGFSMNDVARIKNAAESGNSEKAYSEIDDYMLDATAIYGTPAECGKKMKEFKSSGVDMPIIVPLGPNVEETIKLSGNFRNP
jgi:5,10-methylenetetrahydromethanopterin reductase